ncbi:hypothetical protein SETIT_8G079700v2 [Setaria italica]|uniref:Uncharacterized protein n=2 Tax=Setaria italica TaxID=4555 RepID=A0A368S5E9_SETIT|nr:hypothetical protein SETIT_8G079700v2 [Setaria italica]
MRRSRPTASGGGRRRIHRPPRPPSIAWFISSPASSSSIPAELPRRRRLPARLRRRNAASASAPPPSLPAPPPAGEPPRIPLGPQVTSNSQPPPPNPYPNSNPPEFSPDLKKTLSWHSMIGQQISSVGGAKLREYGIGTRACVCRSNYPILQIFDPGPYLPNVSPSPVSTPLGLLYICTKSRLEAYERTEPKEKSRGSRRWMNQTKGIQSHSQNLIRTSYRTCTSKKSTSG